MNVPTYKSGVLQAKAHRILRQRIGKSLSAFQISVPEWAIIGQLYEHKDGVRLSSLALALDVEAPHITNLVEGLVKKNIIERRNHPQDKRAKLLFLTIKGREKVPTIEKTAKETLRQLLKGISEKEMGFYSKVLDTIVTNA